jgi:hypothetical protein
MRHRAAHIRTDVWEENVTFNIRLERISELQLLVTANVVLRWPILVTLMMENVRPSETSILTRTTRRHIPEDCILRHPDQILQPV